LVIWQNIQYSEKDTGARIFQLRLDEAADVNAENRHGLTALAYAAKFGFANVGELLLEAKALVDARNKSKLLMNSYSSQKMIDLRAASPS